MPETFSVTLPNGEVLTKQVPDGATDKQVRSAFEQDMARLGINVGKQAVQRPAPTNAMLTAYKPSVSERLGDYITAALMEISDDQHFATAMGNRVEQFLTDLTPAGNIDQFLGADNDLERQLAILPLPGPERKAVMKGIRAWHGSARDFDRFSDEFIGTGEGAQGYGFGHYFTESQRLANSYRNPKMIPGLPSNTGHLYEVNINAPQDRFIDLDAQLNTLPAPIQDLARGMDLSHLSPRVRSRVKLERFAQGVDEPISGQEFHSAFTDYGADDAANRHLSKVAADNGFAGFRYGQPIDGLGGGGRNYVVVDPRIVYILNKY